MTFEPTDQEDVWFGVLGLRELVVAAMERELEAAHDLSLAAFVILLALIKHPETLSINNLVPLVPIVSRSQISRIVDALEQRGLVKRSVSSSDARIRFVVITSTGQRLVAKARVTADESSASAMSGLGAADLRLLRKVSSAVMGSIARGTPHA